MSKLMDEVLAHHSPSVRLRAELEFRVIDAVLREAKKSGWHPTEIDYGDDPEKVTTRAQVMKLVFDLDDCYLYFKKGRKTNWMRLVMGNDGWDVICDYGMDGGPSYDNPTAGSLAAAIEKASKPFVDRYG